MTVRPVMSRASNAPQTHLKRTSNARQSYLKRISNAPEAHLKRTSKIIENQQICKKSILQRCYTQIQISGNLFDNKKQKINPGDGHTAKLGKFDQ